MVQFVFNVIMCCVLHEGVLLLNGFCISGLCDSLILILFVNLFVVIRLSFS